MYGQYRDYLFVIVFLIIAIPSVLTVLFFRKRRRQEKYRKPETVKGGNLSVFFDKSGNATLIPYVKDTVGSGKATSRVAVLKTPYTPQKLGLSVKKSLNGCIGSTSCSDTELLAVLGANDWSEFSWNKRNISVYFREGYGLIFNSTTRNADGVFQFNTRGIEKTVPAGIEDAALGNTLLQLLVKCR